MADIVLGQQLDETRIDYSTGVFGPEGNLLGTEYALSDYAEFTQMYAMIGTGVGHSFRLAIYARGVDGKPADLLAQTNIIVSNVGTGFGPYIVDLLAPITLAPGTYWLMMQSEAKASPGGRYYYYGGREDGWATDTWADGLSNPAPAVTLESEHYQNPSLQRDFVIAALGQTVPGPATLTWESVTPQQIGLNGGNVEVAVSGTKSADEADYSVTIDGASRPISSFSRAGTDVTLIVRAPAKAVGTYTVEVSEVDNGSVNGDLEYIDITVTFDGVQATEVVLSGDTIQCRVPAHLPGPVTVEVSRGGVVTTAEDVYTYDEEVGTAGRRVVVMVNT